MRYIDSVENIIFDTDKMQLISQIGPARLQIKIYKTSKNYFAIQRILMRGIKIFKLKESDVKELLAKCDIDAYIREFDPQEGE